MSRTDGRQRRWTQHNADRRDAIIAAAVEEIQAADPGAEFHIAQVAERAGLSRTVVYRHFDDRGDLDHAIQQRIFQMLGAQVGPGLTLEGTPLDIIRRIVTAYVTWAEANTALHRFAEQPIQGQGLEVMDQWIAHIASQIEALILLAVGLLDIELSDDDTASIEPLVFGLVGQGFSAVRRWLATPERRAPAAAFAELLSESIWHQIAGLVAQRGGRLDPDLDLADLLAESEVDAS